MMTRRPLRIGVIGVGWGALVHVPAYRAVDGYEAVALCSRNRERVEAMGARLAIGDLSTDWKSFVKRDDLDLIAVTTPTDLHVEMAIAALEAGKHVLCEKPAALNEKDAGRLYEAGHASDRVTAMCFETPWTPHKYTIWELVKHGFIGRPYLARVCQSAAYWHPSHAPQSAWMYKRDQGGGYLMGQQSHEINFICKLFGEPEAVCADVKTTVTKRTMADGQTIDVDADDTACILMRLQSGANVVLSSSVVGAHTMGYTLDAFGEDGTIVLGADGNLKTGKADSEGLRDHPFSNRPLASGADLGTRRSAVMVRAMALMLEDWLPAFDGKPTPSIATFRDGLRVQQVIDAARRSSEGAGWVQLAPL